MRGEVELPCRIVDDPSAERIIALRKRMKLSRQKFAGRSGSMPVPSRTGNRAAVFQTVRHGFC